jgi:hypothetical protein
VRSVRQKSIPGGDDQAIATARNMPANNSAKGGGREINDGEGSGGLRSSCSMQFRSRQAPPSEQPPGFVFAELAQRTIAAPIAVVVEADLHAGFAQRPWPQRERIAPAAFSIVH